CAETTACFGCSLPPGVIHSSYSNHCFGSGSFPIAEAGVSAFAGFTRRFELVSATVLTTTPTAQTDTQNGTMMRVRKRNGSLEGVDVNKIVRAVGRCCTGLGRVDPLRIATRTIGGLYEGATTRELDLLSIQTAASLIVDEPEYSRLAARLLATYI